MRYHFFIHDLHETHLKKLDQLSKSHIKKWLNFPSRGASDISIFHPYLLKVKQPSQLYIEGHAGNMLLMRLKGDPVEKKNVHGEERNQLLQNVTSLLHLLWKIV